MSHALLLEVPMIFPEFSGSTTSLLIFDALPDPTTIGCHLWLLLQFHLSRWYDARLSSRWFSGRFPFGGIYRVVFSGGDKHHIEHTAGVALPNCLEHPCVNDASETRSEVLLHSGQYESRQVPQIQSAAKCVEFVFVVDTSKSFPETWKVMCVLEEKTCGISKALKSCLKRSTFTIFKLNSPLTLFWLQNHQWIINLAPSYRFFHFAQGPVGKILFR